MTKRGVVKICAVCGKEYYVPQYRAKKSKYCSRDCQNHGQYEHIEKVCSCCGKIFLVSNSRTHKKYCSDLCSKTCKTTMRENRKQSKLLSRIKRGPTTNRTLRRFVFLNKPKRCEICGYDEYDFCLDVHHIDGDCTNNDLHNLKVLCCMCHKKYHKGVIDIDGKSK